MTNNAFDSLFMRVLRREPVERTPVWLMRQAGRYMPEYRAIRARVRDFIALCEDPALACEVTLMPIEQFGLDAAIIFSDILLIGRALGLPLSFREGEGPVFEPAISTLEQVNALSVEAVPEKLNCVSEAIRLTKRALGDTPLIGFCGSPWTVATYMVEGGSSKDFSKIKTMAWQAPQILLALLDKLTQATIDYLKAQVKAGADALMIFDTWGGILSDVACREFSLSWIAKIVSALKQDPMTQKTPVIVFAKGKHTMYDELVKMGADGLSIDWQVNLDWVRHQVQDRVVLQGNLDPTLLLAPAEKLKLEIKRVIDSFRLGGISPGHHIFNLGHGILPPTNPDQVKRLVQWVREFSQARVIS